MEFVSIWMSLKARQNSAFGQVVKDLYFKGRNVELAREDRHLNTVKVFRKVVHLNNVNVRVVVFNANINNMSAISWRLVLFVESTGVPGENY